MAQDSEIAAARAFILKTYSFYECLMQAAPASDAGVSESASLGGCLLWAGELDETGRALTVAGNVAGAATLAAANDAAVQRQIVRDGVVDFLVNSLDEALRILKNEIRKRDTVAVCVAATVEAIEREMVERGVRPDVFREGVLRAADRLGVGERPGNADADPMSVPALVTWHVNRGAAVWLPKIDAVALECLEADQGIARRWLLRSSRYLGRVGQAAHLVWSNREFAARMFERVGTMAGRDELKVPGCIEAKWFGAGNDRLSDRIFFGPSDESSADSQT